MTDFRKLTVEEFISQASSSAPVPGGGSVAAITGAMASSMGQMVLNLTIGKEKYKQFQEQCKAHLAALAKAQEMMLRLMDEDIEAFGEFSAVRKRVEGIFQRQHPVRHVFEDVSHLYYMECALV